MRNERMPEGSAPDAQTGAPRTTRREAIAGAIGGAAVFVADAVLRPLPAQAEATPIYMDVLNQAAGTTEIWTTGTDSTAITARAKGTGNTYGVLASMSSDQGAAVRGYAHGTTGFGDGVSGGTTSPGGAGVSGISGAPNGSTKGVWGVAYSPQGTGVYGYANAPEGPTSGVVGECSSPAGTGVRGEVAATSGATTGVAGVSRSPDGVGVIAVNRATGGTALRVDGKASFSRSGIVEISWPNASRDVPSPPLSAESLVLATVQNDVGAGVQAVVPNVDTNSFRVILDRAPGKKTDPRTAKVAWFIVA